MKPYTYFGAETYNCDAYGQHAFGECGTQGAGTNQGGGLSYTGDIMLVPLALGGAILIASAILIVKRLRRRKAAATDAS